MTLHKIAKWLAIACVFLIPVFPLIVANQFFFPFITGKAFYFRILVEVAFASWVILAFLDAKYRPKMTPVAIGVTAFTVIALLADLLGVNPLRSIWSNFERMEGWLVVIHLWALFMTLSGLFGHGEEGKRWWYRWFNTSLAIAAIVGIYGMVQLFGGAAIHQGSTRVDASLGNAAYMAVYMLVQGFIAAYMYFVARTHNSFSSKRATQWVYAFMAIWFGFLVFETATRGTILGLIGGTLLALGLYALLGKKEPVKMRWMSVGIIGVIILVGVIFWANKDSKFIQSHEVLNRLASISINESKTQARGYIWPMAIKGFTERPILGWGQENFNYIFNANYNPAMWSQEQWFDRAHSVYLDWLVASGSVGFLAYISLYVLLLIGIWKSTNTLAEKSVLTGLVAGYAIHNIFVFDNLASYVLFFAILGFSSSFKEGKMMRWLGGAKPVSKDAVEYIVLPIVLVLLVGGLYFVNIRPIQANTRLIDALQICAGNQADASAFAPALSLDEYMANQEIREQIMSCASGVINSQQYANPIKQGFFELSSSEIEKQIASTPNDARAYVLGGTFMSSVGQVAEADKYLTRSLELSPNKQSIILQLVNTYANENKLDEAIALVKKSYEMTPGHPEIKNVYVRLLILTGKEADARKLFPNEPELFENDVVARIYLSQKKYDAAIAIFRKLIAADPTNIDLKSGLAQAQYTSGNLFAAIQTLNDISKEHPELKEKIDNTIKALMAEKK